AQIAQAIRYFASLDTATKIASSLATVLSFPRTSVWLRLSVKPLSIPTLRVAMPWWSVHSRVSLGWLSSSVFKAPGLTGTCREYERSATEIESPASVMLLSLIACSQGKLKRSLQRASMETAL